MAAATDYLGVRTKKRLAAPLSYQSIIAVLGSALRMPFKWLLPTDYFGCSVGLDKKEGPYRLPHPLPKS
jgi:hypothetical protein